MDTSIALTATEHQPSVTFPEGITLDCGVHLPSLTVAYRTCGTLNAARSNAVLVCHALTGDQYVADRHPVTGKDGWWDTVVGAGRPLDTDRYFVICANVLGGCMGSTGPRSLRQDGKQPWGTDFPPVTIHDMVRAQKMLIDHLGISRLFAVMGGSMGGMQVLQWAASYPDAVFAALPIACAATTPPRTSPSTRWGGRRSLPIRTGRRDAIGRPAGCRRVASRWRGCARTSRICPSRR